MKHYVYEIKHILFIGISALSFVVPSSVFATTPKIPATQVTFVNPETGLVWEYATQIAPRLTKVTELHKALFDDVSTHMKNKSTKISCSKEDLESIKRMMRNAIGEAPKDLKTILEKSGLTEAYKNLFFNGYSTHVFSPETLYRILSLQYLTTEDGNPFKYDPSIAQTNLSAVGSTITADDVVLTDYVTAGIKPITIKITPFSLLYGILDSISRMKISPVKARDRLIPGIRGSAEVLSIVSGLEALEASLTAARNGQFEFAAGKGKISVDPEFVKTVRTCLGTLPQASTSGEINQLKEELPDRVRSEAKILSKASPTPDLANILFASDEKILSALQDITGINLTD